MIWHNVISAPQRWAAAWLRHRGWIVFWLDPEARHCGPNLMQFAGWLSAEIPELHHVEADRLVEAVQRWEQHHAGTCWLALYEAEERRHAR